MDQTCGVKGAVTPAFQSSATSMPNSTISALMAGEKKSLGHASTAWVLRGREKDIESSENDDANEWIIIAFKKQKAHIHEAWTSVCVSRLQMLKLE